jgi:uncharacterized membrane protein
VSPTLFFHISTATLGLLSGVAAMSLRKGSPWHRVAGNVFTISMLSMSASAAYLALMKAQTLNALVGCLTFCLVATAWLTARRKDPQTGIVDRSALLFASALGAILVVYGLEAANAQTGLKDGEPAAGYFAFGTIALISAALDARLIVHGGQVGAHRLARHLWRMCFPMLIAVVSVVPRLHRLFPRLFSNDIVLYAPIVLMLVATIYWLCRVLLTSAYKRSALGANIIEP